jgi:hypothetical protein
MNLEARVRRFSPIITAQRDLVGSLEPSIKGMSDRSRVRRRVITSKRDYEMPNIGPLAHREEQGTFNPKVPGSRPGRPTKLLVRGLVFNLSDSNVANDVANALDVLGESTGASL